MTKYLLSRLGRGIISIILVVLIVMFLIYTLMERQQIFATDGNWQKQQFNDRTVYEYQQWEKFGYLDYVSYSDWMQGQLNSGEITEDEFTAAVTLGKTAEEDSEAAKASITKFIQYYEDLGYKI